MQLKIVGIILASVFACYASFAGAADRADPADWENAHKPVDKRFYVAPLASYGFFDEDTFDPEEGPGVHLAIGKSFTRFLALEVFASHYTNVNLERNNPDDAELEATGYGLSALFFPARHIFPVFGIIGVGKGEVDVDDGSVATADIDEQDSDFFDVGLGFLFPVNKSGASIRGEYRYRKSEVESISSSDDYEFRDHIISLGFHIPLGDLPEPPPKPAPVVAPVPVPVPAPVVPAAPVDSDGDGVPDNRDQCPGSPPGTPVDANGCPLQKQAPIVLKGVNFEYNSATLTAQAQDRLDNVVNALAGSPEIRVRIEGHTDSKGSASYNLSLSRERAASVSSYLISHGIDSSRLQSEGFGETRPIAPNTKPSGADNPAGRAQNRRVELHVVE